MNKLRRTIILLLILLSFSCSLLGKPTNVNYLIPENFIGGVIILYNQPDGITPETTEDGTIIYRIPQDGFLKVKSPLKRINYKFNYYFVDTAGKRTPIEYLYPKYYVRDPGDTTSKSFDTLTEGEQVNQTFIMLHETTNFNVQESKVYLHNFIVGKPKNAELLYLRMLDRMDEIQKNFLKIKVNFKASEQVK